MISAGDFRNGVTYEIEGQVMQVLFQVRLQKLHSTQQQSLKVQQSSAKLWNIATAMATYTTSWKWTHMKWFQLMVLSLATASVLFLRTCHA